MGLLLTISASTNSLATLFSGRGHGTPRERSGNLTCGDKTTPGGVAPGEPMVPATATQAGEDRWVSQGSGLWPGETPPGRNGHEP